MESIAHEWPVSFSDLVVLGEKTAQIGIVTLWTKKEFVVKHLLSEHYALVGQLYSRHEGLNGLIRNCLANKNIRHLVIVGIDLNKSAEALTSFFMKGVDSTHRVIGLDDVIIDVQIPLESLETLRKHVTLHDFQHIKDFSQLSDLIKALPVLSSYGISEIFPENVPIAPDMFPSEKSGFVIHEDYVGPAWLRILLLISRFGSVKKSQYGDDQRELLNIITVIGKEDPNNPQFHSYFPFTHEDLLAYYPQIVTAQSIDGIEYSYGQRLRGRQEGDQIQHIVEALQQTLYTRRAIAITWKLSVDMESAKPPCLILTQFLVQENELFLTAFFRSNDMYHAWPRNAFGLRKLQFLVAEILGLHVGSLTIHSSSAHIYQRNWDNVSKILDVHAVSLNRIGDPRGNLIIRLVSGKIVVTHTSPSGKVLDTVTGTDVFSIYGQLVRDERVGVLSHALYLGAELQKAKIALDNGLAYIQDKKLEF
jgi:thymidylate synthase